ncbi:MAG: hypothetical protein H6Q74_2847 [Firmicutes bacterium]|nr:hypothetical protein [Bacillota bacterium]
MTSSTNQATVTKDSLANLIDLFTEWSLNWIPDSMVFVCDAIMFTDYYRLCYC